MSIQEITAEQARQNSNSATHGVDEVLKGLYQSITANSKTGVTSIVSMIHVEAASDAEMGEVLERLKQNGFKAESSRSADIHKVTVSW